MEKKFDKVYVEITNVCNLACEFCPEGKRKKEFMSVEQFNRILEQIKPVTNMIMLHVKGEPLLHPELKEILQTSKKHGITVTITTNGTLLTEKQFVLKQAEALRQINISLHSYTQNKKRQEDYMQKVCQAVDELKETTYISYRLWNLKEYQANLQNKEILDYLGQHYKIENLWNKAENKLFLELDHNVFLNQDRQFQWPSMGQREYGKCGTCYGLRKQIAILVNGDVVPCCMDAEGELQLGNIFESSLSEILENEKAKAMVAGFQRRELIEPFCRTCGFIQKFN